MRSNSSAYGLPTSARHSRWPEPPHPEEQYPGRRCSRDYSCKRRMYFGCPRPGYVQNSQSRPKGTDYLINAGNRPILHVRAEKDTECGSPDFVTDFRNTTGSSPVGAAACYESRSDVISIRFPGENIFLGDIIRSRDRWFPGRSPDGYFPYASRTGITESNRPPRRLPNPLPRFHPLRAQPTGR